ncbi:stage III sporulation protein AE [Alicyclobacillus herbarius]|uniref:stage III sporulation protein AE n=1 Tax=Alicyclobacillus herbarius TaxID=122960 RepID=UPI000412F092|nr:stage III sporulation protein AE [Alicyclobacillus herbarius]
MWTRRFGRIGVILLTTAMCLIVTLFGSPHIVHAEQADNPTAATTSVSSAAATTAHDMLEKAAEGQLDDLPTESITKFWTELEQEYGGYLPEASGTDLIRSILDNGGVNLHGFTAGLLEYFFHEVLGNLRILGSILILAVLAAVLESLQTAFERQTVSQVAYAMIFFVLMILAIGSFTQAMGYAKHAIHTMTDFMLATVPLAVTLLAASGAPASAAFFHPILLFAVHMISNVVFLLVFPMIFFAAVLDITSALSPRYQLTRLAGLLRTIGVGVLGLSLTVFLGIASVQGLGRGIADGVAMRTAKFAVGAFVPVIGKALSDAAETVVSASLLVKNAVGIAGLIILACIAVFPALKILALALIYNGSAALMQPLGETSMVNCLGALAKSLILVFASVAAVALMFFISICILLAAANIAAVMT